MRTAHTGVLFGQKHSYQDFGLTMTERPKIGAPKPKTVSVNIQGADGTVDLTEATSGEVRYANRTISCRFAAAPAQQNELHSLLMAELHGKVLEIVLDEDDAWYYRGRVSVGEPDRTRSAVSWKIQVDAEPYKRKRALSERVFSVDAFAEAKLVVLGDVPRNQQDLEEDYQATFRFGPTYGGGNFTPYQLIRLDWDPTRTWHRSQATVTIVDTAGSHSWTVQNVESGLWSMTAADLTAAGVLLSGVRQVKLDGVSGATLRGRLGRCWSTTLQGGRMSVSPDVLCSSSLIGTVLVIGKQAAELASGWRNYSGLVLTEGVNTIAVSDTAGTCQGGTLTLRFREGAL